MTGIFQLKGRSRQAKRMFNLSKDLNQQGKDVVADFICPTAKTRNEFKPDKIIWMDTINKGRFDDTNKLLRNLKTMILELQ